MSELPEILIQIHYHIRPGGVSTVIKRYSETFTRCKKDNAENFIIASLDGADKKEFTSSLLINMKECDYHYVCSEREFKSLRKVLFTEIEKIILSVKNKSIVFVAHNLSLVKNPALSSAVYLLSKKYGSSTIRFFSVIHDFSENGRGDLISQITLIETFGIDIRKELFFIGAPAHCVAPSANTYNLLKKTKFNVTLLQNPVASIDITRFENKRSETLQHFRYYTRQWGMELDIKKKIYYYPVRLISRKNILEAIVLACFALNGILLTGPCATRSIDQERFNIIDSFVKKHGLSVIFNSVDAIKALNVKMNSVAYLMSICDAAISTSVAEGFGFGLYEPWLYGKAIIGRKPSGFISPFCDDSVYYSWFPVPREWVSLEKISKIYEEKYFEYYKEKINWNPESIFCKESTVDFGALDETAQIQIIRNAIEDSRKMEMWMELLWSSSTVWPGIESLINAAKINVFNFGNHIRNKFSDDNFEKRFRLCFSQIPSTIPETIDPFSIQKKFQSPEFFRLLLNPEKIVL